MISEQLQDQLREAFKESFMQPEIEETDYYEVETNEGTETVPADVVGKLPFLVYFHWSKGSFYDLDAQEWFLLIEAIKDYVSGRDIVEITAKHGFIARLSAPGYMDCTDWSAFETADEAAEYLIEMYGDE